MTEDNVVGIRKEVQLVSARKQEFLNAVSQSFDQYVRDWGHEPDALIYVQTGWGMKSVSSWHVEGKSEGCAGPLIALAGTQLSANSIEFEGS